MDALRAVLAGTRGLAASRQTRTWLARSEFYCTNLGAALIRPANQRRGGRVALGERERESPADQSARVASMISNCNMSNKRRRDVTRQRNMLTIIVEGAGLIAMLSSLLGSTPRPRAVAWCGP